jgi:hypothetical protein
MQPGGTAGNCGELTMDKLLYVGLGVVLAPFLGWCYLVFEEWRNTRAAQQAWERWNRQQGRRP